jgi:hypothetical protein
MAMARGSTEISTFFSITVDCHLCQRFFSPCDKDLTYIYFVVSKSKGQYETRRPSTNDDNIWGILSIHTVFRSKY